MDRILADWSNAYTATIAIEGVLLLAACVMALRTRESSEHGWRYFFIGLSFSAFLYLLGALFMVLRIQPRLGGLYDKDIAILLESSHRLSHRITLPRLQSLHVSRD